jgi:hypothetical protein
MVCGNVESEEDVADQPKLVAARYIGHHAARLAQRLAFNIDGTRRESSLLESGDTLMMPEREILGFTLLHDPHMASDPLDLGAGKRVLPEHAGMNPEQLDALGYQFNAGRSDFEPLEVEGSIEPSAPADEAPSDVPQEPEQAVQETPPADSAQEALAQEQASQPDPLTVLSNLSSGG